MSYPLDESAFAEKVRHEIEAARRKHPKPINSPLEAYGIICEELAEFFEVCRGIDCRPNRKLAMAEELMQIAAMCQTAAEDLDLPVRQIRHKHREIGGGAT